jgi:hypothetical protein
VTALAALKADQARIWGARRLPFGRGLGLTY